MKKYTFSKEERLCKKAISDQLFHEGSSFMLYPYRVVFLTASPEFEDSVKDLPQIMISVPKKRFKKAVSRNLIKRRIKECYRLQKEEMLYHALESDPKNLFFAVQYVGKEIEPYAFMFLRMQKMLKRLVDEIQKKQA